MNVLVTSSGKRVSLVRAFNREILAFSPEGKIFTSDRNPELSAACNFSDKYFRVCEVTEPQYAHEILSLCLENDIKIIIPTIDPELQGHADHQALFDDAGVHLIISHSSFVADCCDKRRTNDFFCRKGIETPAPIDKKNPSFPLFIKPYNGCISFDLGNNYDWVTNPETGFTYDIRKHWTEITDFSHEAGDIKYVWEKSRFSFLYNIIRYDYHFDQDCSDIVFNEILSWIEHNPINCGPNYKSSQEIMLRVLNWLFALYYYKHSPTLSEAVFEKILQNIYWQSKHVYANINFSRIAVRNNHAITETMGLYLSGLLLPFFEESSTWKENGKKWFQKEVAYQVYPDGTFLQFSMNYHRVVIQLLTWGIRLSQLNNEKLDSVVIDRAAASLHFLFNCMNIRDGHMPNYGSNDGALFFPLNDEDFRNYRPQLHALSAILGEGRIEEFNEDQYWYGIHDANKNVLKQSCGVLSYRNGGYYLLREQDSFTFIRCGKHKDRPAHADNLHIDLWVNGENILRDSGSFKYNTEKEFQDYFLGTMSHNSVMVGNYSQMIKGDRFTWFFWSQAKKAEWYESADEYIFKGEISAFRFLNPSAVHYRTVIKRKGKKEWIITDKVEGLPNIKKNQIWHHDNHKLDFAAFVKGDQKAEAGECKSYNSNYYGVKEKGNASAFVFDSEISTTLRIED